MDSRCRPALTLLHGRLRYQWISSRLKLPHPGRIVMDKKKSFRPHSQQTCESRFFRESWLQHQEKLKMGSHTVALEG